ncbi:hypothetical protein ACMT9U_10860 [Clavibacter sp. Sh2036]|uniref:hypothetical protein n=1 Tax=Clavibacter sp. Sh2036 TaxID=3397677 RepID=UPI0039E17EDF
MTNPASDLLEILDAWVVRPAGLTLRNVRDQAPTEGATWDYVDAGCRSLGEIRRALDDMDQDGQKTRHWRQYIPVWYELLISPGINWDEAIGSDLNLDSRGTALNMLAAMESVLAVAPSHFRDMDKTDVLSALAALEQLLESHDGLSEQLRKYILTLLDEIRVALVENRRYGDVPVARRINELAGALASLAEETADDPAFAAKLKGIATRITTFARHASTGGLLALGASADVAQIAGTISPPQ